MPPDSTHEPVIWPPPPPPNSHSWGALGFHGLDDKAEITGTHARALEVIWIARASRLMFSAKRPRRKELLPYVPQGLTPLTLQVLCVARLEHPPPGSFSVERAVTLLGANQSGVARACAVLERAKLLAIKRASRRRLTYAITSAGVVFIDTNLPYLRLEAMLPVEDGLRLHGRSHNTRDVSAGSRPMTIEEAGGTSEGLAKDVAEAKRQRGRRAPVETGRGDAESQGRE